VSDSATDADLMAYRLRSAGIDGDMIPAANRLELTINDDPRALQHQADMRRWHQALNNIPSASAATSDPMAGLESLAASYRASGMDGATGDPLTFDLPPGLAASAGLKPPSEGFFAGLTGHSRSVFDGTTSFSEDAGLLTRGLVRGPIVGAYGLYNELRNQVADTYDLYTLSSGEQFTPSSALFNSYQRNGAGDTWLNVGKGALSAPSQPFIDLLDGRYENAGEGLPGSLAMGMGIAGKLRGPRLGGSSGSTFIDFNAADGVTPGFYRADPTQLRFMQPTVSPNYSTGGHTIASTADDLRFGRVTPDQLGDPLRVVMVEGKPFSFDNRRIVSYNLADVSDVPIQVMGLDDAAFATRVRARFNPIDGEGLRVVVTPSSERSNVMADLYRRGLIQRPK
jgi:hypothetical protein